VYHSIFIDRYEIHRMTSPPTKIYDFTSTTPAFSIQVETRPVYEALAHLFVWTQDHPADYEDSAAFELAKKARPALRNELKTWGSMSPLWPALFGVVAESDVTSVADLAEVVYGPTLRRLLIAHSGGDTCDADMVEAAAVGDSAATQSVLAACNASEDLVALLALSDDDLAAKVTSILAMYAADIEPALIERMPTLERSVEEKRALARRTSPADLVEQATNGVTLEMGPRVEGILLIPSIVMRPWALISEAGGIRIVVYSVTDDVLNADPDAPPRYLVNLFKAVGDEKRLAMLKHISKGGITLRDLADRMGLAKSTTHHHVGALRSAGLVRVVVTDDDKYYEIRTRNIAEAGPLLERFLNQQS
jgi:DNA-binding transcriptional ArsR family regulator